MKKKDLASEYPYSLSDIIDIQKRLKCTDKQLKSVLNCSIKMHIDLSRIVEVLEYNKWFEEDQMITEEIFYNKELSDIIRDIVITSVCDYNTAVKLLTISKDHKRDSCIIKKLLNKGVSKECVRLSIYALNND